jgi:hypothetical protein
MLARLYYEQGDQESAVKYLHKTLAINTHHDAARLLLEKIEQNSGSESNFD